MSSVSVDATGQSMPFWPTRNGRHRLLMTCSMSPAFSRQTATAADAAHIENTVRAALEIVQGAAGRHRFRTHALGLRADRVGADQTARECSQLISTAIWHSTP